MTAALYDSAVRMFALGGLDWESDSIKVLLADDRYVPDQTADQTRADLGLGEVTPAGSYRSGGSALLGRTVESSPSRLILGGGSVEWRAFTGAYRWAVVYQSSGGDDRSRDNLIAYTDLGLQSVTDATVTVDFGEAGVCVFTVGAAS